MIEIAANKALDDQSPNGDRQLPDACRDQRDRGAALPVPVRAGGSSGALPLAGALDLEDQSPKGDRHCPMRDGISGIVAQLCQSPLGREDRRAALIDDQSPNGDRHCPMHAGISGIVGQHCQSIRAVEAEAALPIPVRAWRAYDI